MPRFAWALLALAMLGASPSPDRYAAGQVWAYHVRAGDDGSLLKIQAVDSDIDTVLAHGGPAYHISIIAVHICSPTRATAIIHLPVTQGSLDASVTTLTDTRAPFPDASASMERWRTSQGKIVSMSVANVIEAASQAFKAKGVCAKQAG